MHYLLFLPGKRAANPQNLHDVGLGALLRPDDAAPMYADLLGAGPGGEAGQMVTWAPASPVYQPDRQLWRRAAPDPVRNLPGGRYWVGWWAGEPPTPEELARPKVIFGRARLRYNGFDWQVPSLLNLPCRLSLCEQTGSLLRTPKPEYDDWRREVDFALDLVRIALEGDLANVSLEHQFAQAVRLLQLNYRMVPELAVELGPLVDEESIFQTLVAACDSELLSTITKKPKPAVSTSSVSPAGDTA